MKFTIAIEAETKTTAFGVVVPDLPGCFSAGDTIEEAFDNAREAIEAYCAKTAESGDDLTAQKSMSEWQKNKEFAGWTWGIVDVPVEKLFGRAEKINITVPSALLHRIDREAAARNTTRSGLMTESTMKAIHDRAQKIAAETIERAIPATVRRIKRASGR